MEPYEAPTTHDLLAHESFLSDLSYSLVGDRQTADDLVQDTWLTALERPPRHQSNLGAWLRAVARNLAIRRVRTSKRRIRRETEVARPESSPSGSALSEREETLDAVTTAVNALDEPYHTVILLRFFEDLPPREIAARLDRPVKTVKSQLHRGLEKLRKHLSDEFEGDQQAWRSSLIAIFGFERPVREVAGASAVGAGGLSWLLDLKVLAALLLALVGVGLWWSPLGEQELAVEGLDARVSLREADRGATEDLSLATPNEGSLPRVAPLAEAAEEDAASVARPLELLVQDPEGTRVADAELFAYDGDSRRFVSLGRTDADGRLLLADASSRRTRPVSFIEVKAPLPRLEERVGLLARSDRHASSDVYWVDPTSCEEPVELTLGAAGFRLEGRVIDGLGRGVEGARITRQEVEKGRRAQRDGTLIVNAPLSTVTDHNGNYVLEQMPKGLYWLRVAAPGYRTHWERKITIESGDVTLDLELERGGSLAGTARDKSGNPVPGARVWFQDRSNLHDESCRADELGRFRMDGIPVGRGQFFFVQGGPGNSLIARETLEIRAGQETQWYPELDESEGIHLRFTDEDGVPWKGLNVSILARGPQRSSTTSAITDADGLVSTFDYPGKLRRVEVHPAAAWGTRRAFPIAELEGFVPSKTVHTIEVPRVALAYGSLVGRFTRHDGEPFKEFAISVRAAHEDAWRRVRRRTGGTEIDVPNLPPGEYQVIAQCGEQGCARLAPFTILPGEQTDLGERKAPAPGRVAIEWHYSAEDDLSFEIMNQALASGSDLEALWLANTGTGAPEAEYELLPGSYKLHVLRGTAILQQKIFEITSGARTELTVGPQEALESLITIAPASEVDPGSVRLQVWRLRSAQNEASVLGAPVFEERVDADPAGRFESVVSLHEGAYLIVVHAGSHEARLTCEVGTGADVSNLLIELP